MTWRKTLLITASLPFLLGVPQSQAQNIVFQDNFNRMQLGPDWQISTGNGQVGIVNGALQLSNGGGGISSATLIAPGTNLRDAAVSFDVDNGGPTRANNIMQIFIGSFDVAINQDTSNDPVVFNRRSVKLNGPAGTLAAVGEIIIIPGRYEFSVSGSAVRFRNILGGTPIDLQAVDTTPTGPGPVIFAVNDEPAARIDNLLLTGLAQAPLILTHLAVGGDYATHLTVVEPHGSARTATVEFFDDSGSMMFVNVNGGASVSSVTLQLSSYEERVLVLTRIFGPVAVGWARVSTGAPGKVEAALRFVRSVNGNVADAVGILPSEEVHYWTVTVDQQRAGDRVGIAVVNNTASAITITFGLWDGPNRVAGTGGVNRTIPARGHLSLFASGGPNELYNINFIGVGTLAMTSSVNFAAVALRLENDELSSLPASKAAERWSLVSPSSGSATLGGTWQFTFVDSGTFYGIENNTIGSISLVFLRGFRADDRFVAERLYNESDGTRGTVLYQGVLSDGGSTVNGQRVQIRQDGTIVSSQSFRATRSN